jgi:hypothetical protein
MTQADYSKQHFRETDTLPRALNAPATRIAHHALASPCTHPRPSPSGPCSCAAAWASNHAHQRRQHGLARAQRHCLQQDIAHGPSASPAGHAPQRKEMRSAAHTAAEPCPRGTRASEPTSQTATPEASVRRLHAPEAHRNPAERASFTHDTRNPAATYADTVSLRQPPSACCMRRALPHGARTARLSPQAARATFAQKPTPACAPPIPQPHTVQGSCTPQPPIKGVAFLPLAGWQSGGSGGLKCQFCWETGTRCCPEKGPFLARGPWSQ